MAPAPPVLLLPFLSPDPPPPPPGEEPIIPFVPEGPPFPAIPPPSAGYAATIVVHAAGPSVPAVVLPADEPPGPPSFAVAVGARYHRHRLDWLVVLFCLFRLKPDPTRR